MSDIRVQTLGRFDAEVGEGPVWLDESGELLWIDMPTGQIHRTAAEDGVTRTISVDGFLGAVVPREAGGFAAGTRTGFATVDADGTLHPEPAILASGHRMNDAKCDPRGRFWSGSTEMGFAPGEGALHILDADRSSRILLDGLTLPNGMAWSTSGDTYYLADTIDGVVWAFGLDLDTCELTHRRALCRFEPSEGMPDGLCIDTAGCLWVALWGGARVVQVSPDGDRLSEVQLPAAQTSSCAFGGRDLDVLFVTSARAGLDAGADDGALFAIHGLASGGLPAVRYAG